MLLDFLYPAILLVALSGLPSPTVAAKPKNAILLSDVQSLTLRAGRQTAHRRVAAMPQLKCVSPRAVCALHEVDTMRCVNQGSGYGSEDIQWSCSASLPPELKLGSTEVMCEGYSSPDDPYVLSGSCGVEYRLVLTEEGLRRYPDLGGGGGGGSDGTLPAWLFWVFFVAIVCWILYSAFTAQPGEFRGPRPGRNNFWGGGGGGGGGPGPGFFGGGGWNDPPPPYPGNKPAGSGGGWQPGFWSGLAGGAAAGYMAGNRGRNNTENNRGYGSFGGGRNTWGGGSSWGGAGGAGPSSSRSSGSSSSSARYESTGFGGTSRR